MEMKKIIYFILILSTAIAISSCKEEENSKAFAIDTTEITLPAEGGTQAVKVSSDKGWVATTEAEWIMISPANGNGTAHCEIIVDTTLTNDFRKATIRFTSSNQEVTTLQVNQSGYSKEIVSSKAAVELKNYAVKDKRYFYVQVSSNVDFTVEIPDTVTWVRTEQPDIDLDRGSRPRTVNMRFEWEVNTRPWDREAKISFVAKNGEKLDRSDVIVIKQAAGEKIEDNRQGDSLALLAIQRNLNVWREFDSSENLNYWNGVDIWESTDEGVTPDKIGRVRSVKFFLFDTKEGLPYEVQYLTKAEGLTFMSNSNSQTLHLNLGTYITKLTNLKRLNLFSYGLTELPPELAKLKNLESLDLTGNNFATVPDVITRENFPNLKFLSLSTNRIYEIYDLSNTVYENVGLEQELPERLFEWAELDTLQIGVNYFHGTVPDMKNYSEKYTLEDCVRDTLPESMVGTPKVLPNAREMRLNLNKLRGEIPDWILYHPHLMDWDADILVFVQEGRDREGNAVGFTNIPENFDYYHKFYAKREELRKNK